MSGLKDSAVVSYVNIGRRLENKIMRNKDWEHMTYIAQRIWTSQSLFSVLKQEQ